jgi:linoleoyl-CoA desaturase
MIAVDNSLVTRPTFPAPAPDSERARYESLCRDLDDVKERALARVGSEDVAHVKRLNLFSRAMEVVGRALIFFSFEPFAFVFGVFALWIHKQLQSTEIGHTALHGAYDKLAGAERFASKTFYWDTPIDEESWRHAHNVRHHGHTNVFGRDPDVHFGPVRLTDKTPWSRHHRWQLPFSLAVLFPLFGFVINMHVTGLSDAYTGEGLPPGNLPDRSPESIRAAWKKALRKYVPYYLYNFVLFPVLAGPHWGKVLLGCVLAEVARDVYSAATIFCGHVGHDVESYPEGARAHGRGQWYAMQIRSANDYEVSLPISILCGALDRQIEHHLFPTLPPQRLREIAPEVRAICERHGIEYKTASWGSTLRKALGHIGRLARQGGVNAVVREMA